MEKKQNWIDLVDDWEVETCEKLELAKKNKEVFVHSNLNDLLASIDEKEKLCSNNLISNAIKVATENMRTRFHAKTVSRDNDMVFVLPAKLI